MAISSSLLISGHVASSAHDFDTVTDDGFIRNHRSDGEYLYGIDIAVAREYQGYKLARRLYEARKELVSEKNLKGIVIGGRIPGYLEHKDELTPDEYVDKVLARELDDPVLVAQLANGFEIIRVIADYLPEDEESCGNAVLMVWKNPDYKPERGGQNQHQCPVHRRPSRLLVRPPGEVPSCGFPELLLGATTGGSTPPGRLAPS